MNHNPDNWITTQVKAICTPEDTINKKFWEKTYLKYIAEDIYPRLWQSGYEIPLNIIVDLGCLYLSGSWIDFKCPIDFNDENRSTLKQLLDDYCECMNKEAREEGLTAIIEEANRAVRRLEKSKEESSNPGAFKNNKVSSGLFPFLELISKDIYSLVLENEMKTNKNGGGANDTLFHVLSQIRPLITGKKIRQLFEDGLIHQALNNRQLNENDDSIAMSFIEFFLENITSIKSNGRKILAAPFENNEENKFIVLADIHKTLDPQALDLYVLQKCMEYEPLELDEKKRSRYNRLRRTLTPRENPFAKSPEFGIRGIARKGPPSAILRSFIARGNFTIRFYLKQLLYFKRHKPEEVPYRVLLMYILNRGVDMQSRIGDKIHRYDAYCRILLAYILEDAVRYFNELRALDLHVALIMHDGVNCDSYDIIIPTEEVLGGAPSANDGNCPWLTKVDEFRPGYFYREPWEYNVKKTTGDKLPPYQKAIRILEKRVGLLGDYYSFKFDLCHASVFEPKVYQNQREKERGVHLLKQITEKISLSYFYAENDMLKLDHVSSKTKSGLPSEEDLNELNFKESVIRGSAWDLLLQELEFLGG